MTTTLSTGFSALMQVAMGTVHSWPEFRGTSAGWLLTVYAWVAFGLFWILGVRTLSRAGVRSPWHRSLFLTVVVPLTVIAALGTPLLGVAIVRILFSGPGKWLPLALSAVVGLSAVIFLLGRLTRRMVKLASLSTESARHDDQLPSADEEGASGR